MVGYVDENNIIVSGNLADGTYTAKYEMTDGSMLNIGNLALDTNVYYSVTNTLTNCTNSNTAKEVVEGESYSATITAKDGYELKSVTVTMGGKLRFAGQYGQNSETMSDVTATLTYTPN